MKEVSRLPKNDDLRIVGKRAGRASVSQDTIHRWIRNRNMPAHQIGPLWKFKVSEVDEWVRQGEKDVDQERE